MNSVEVTLAFYSHINAAQVNITPIYKSIAKCPKHLPFSDELCSMVCTAPISTPRVILQLPTDFPKSALLLSQIPREIPLPHRRHHNLRPRRLCNTHPKASSTKQYLLLPLAVPTSTHQRALRPHKCCLFRARPRRSALCHHSTSSRCHRGAKSK